MHNVSETSVGGYACSLLKNLHTLVDLFNDDLLGFLECFLVFVAG